MKKEQKQDIGEKIISSTNDAEAIGHPRAKKKKKSRSRPYTLLKISSKWITDLKVKKKKKAVKFLEYNIGGKVPDDLGMVMSLQKKHQRHDP